MKLLKITWFFPGLKEILRDVLAPQSRDGAAEFSSSNLISQVCLCSAAAPGEEQAGNSLAGCAGVVCSQKEFSRGKQLKGCSRDGGGRRGITTALPPAAAAALDTVMNPKLSPNPRVSRNFGHPHLEICREILFIITQNNFKYAPKKISALLCVRLRANSRSALYKTVLSKILDPNFRGLSRPQVELEKSNSICVMQNILQG